MKLDKDYKKKFSKLVDGFIKDFELGLLDSPARTLNILASQFQYETTIAAMYKLWSPGIMTISDLINVTGLTERRTVKEVASLMSLGILEEQTRGIYAGGAHAELMMNLFAWMLTEGNKSFNDSWEA